MGVDTTEALRERLERAADVRRQVLAELLRRAAEIRAELALAGEAYRNLTGRPLPEPTGGE